MNSSTVVDDPNPSLDDLCHPVSHSVLIYTPLEADGRALQHLLKGEGIESFACQSPEQLQKGMNMGAGALLMTEEVLSPAVCTMFVDMTTTHEPWAQIPIVLIASSEREKTRALKYGLPEKLWGHLTVLERPLTPELFLLTIQTALQTRQHQYDLREITSALRKEIGEREAAERRLQTLNKTLEKRVAARTSQVEDLTTALSLAERRERERISRLLHDHLQQLLIAAQIQIEMLQRRKPDNALDQVEDILNEALEMTRALSVELVPPIAEGASFTESLRWLASWMEETYHLAIRLQEENAPNIPSDQVRHLLFPIVRELLFNVVKHAGINRARVSVTGKPECCIITVSDGGAGFDTTTLTSLTEPDSQGVGLGLASIEQRLQLVGGHMEIRSAPGEGTTITVSVPVGEE